MAGAFLGRVLGEWVGLPNGWVAAGLSLALGALGAWISGRRSIARTWPALIFLAYIVYPEPRAVYAALVAAVAAIAWALLLIDRPVPNRDRDSGVVAALLRPVRPWAMAVGACFFLLYAFTLAPDILPADSGELQVVAAQLGVAHPPGFPLYTLAAHLLVRLLPFVSPACAVNLFSAVTSAVTVSVVFLAAWLITRDRIASLIAAVALGTATTFWSQATTANVRSLTGLFAALILFGLIAFRHEKMRAEQGRPDRWLILTALFMGFGLTHHISLVFLIGVGLVFVLIVDPAFIRAPGRWWRPLLAGLSGLVPLFYFPLRASAEVRGATPGLATWPGFLEHVLASGFRGDLFYYLAPSDFVQRLRIMGNVMAFQFEVLVLIGIMIGIILLLWRDRSLAWLLAGTLAAFILVAATYRAPQTVEYMLPGYVAAALLLACGLAYMAGMIHDQGEVGRSGAIFLCALVAVSAGYQAVTNLTAAGRFHEGRDSRAFTELLLKSAPPNSAILAHWHWVTPLWYLQEIEGLRSDIEIQYVFPEGESYDAAWERRVREAHAAGLDVITTWIPVAPLADLPVPEPIGEAQLYPAMPRESLPDDFVGTELLLADSIHVLGYHVDQPDNLKIGEEAAITVAWRPLAKFAQGTTLFVHLVGQDALIYAQDDKLIIPAEGITLTQFRVTPRPGTSPGALQVYIGTSGESVTREPLAGIIFNLSDVAPYTRNVVERLLMTSLPGTLVGYDWDHTLADRSRLYLHWRTVEGYYTQVIDDAAVPQLQLPPYRGVWGVPVSKWRFPRGLADEHYVPFGQGIVWSGEMLNDVGLAPGESLVLNQDFHSAKPINRDYVVSVRLIGLEADGVHWAWWDLQDSIPAMGAIPTLKWVDGSFVRSPHRVTAAASAVPGQSLTCALAIYDSFTNRPLPILDERLTAENPWVPHCRGTVQPAK